MANKKFSEFVLKTDTSGVSHIVGYNGAENVQITPANFIDTTGGPYLPLIGGTMTGITQFNDHTQYGDQVQARFGASNDLVIEHNGGNSFIKDTGTGVLNIQGSTQVVIGGINGQIGFQYVEGANTAMRHANVTKLSTKSSGITITGVLDATGYFSVEGTTGNTGVGTDRWIGGDGTAGTWFYNVPTGSSHLFGVNNVNILTLDSSSATFTGLVKIEDTIELTDAGATRGKIELNASDRDDLDIKAISLGSNMKFFTVDSEKMRLDSLGNLGIGTQSPTDKIDIAGAARFTTNVSFSSANAGRIYKASNHGLALQGVTGTENDFAIFTPTGALKIIVPTGTNNLILNSANGNVGVANSIPLQKFDTPNMVIGGSTIAGVYRANSLAIDNNGGISRFYSFGPNTSSTGAFTFNTSNSDASINPERMRLSAAGNLGIGINPDAFGKLTVGGTGNIFNLNATTGKVNQVFYENGVGRFYLSTLGGTDGLSFIDGDGTTERMRIDENGKIKIGNNIPMWSGSYGGALYLKGNNATAERYAELTTIDSNGITTGTGLVVRDTKTGIQTYNPTASLQVGEAINFAGALASKVKFVVDAANNTDVNNVLNLISKFDGSPAAEIGSGSALLFSGGIGDAQTRTYAKIIGRYQGNNMGGLEFQTQDSADSISTKMTINKGNDVGASNVTINSGDLVIATSGKGILLGGTGASNRLDDYEEGTWNGTIKFGGGDTGITYAANAGTYTKIGRMVNYSIRFILTSKGSSTGQMTIEGIPFTAANITGNYGSSVVSFARNMVLQTNTFFTMDNSSSIIRPRYLSGSGSYSDYTNSEISNTTDLILNGSFQAV